jgi:cofilin
LGHQHRFIFFKMTDDLKEVVFEKQAPASATYEDFVSTLPPNDCRYAVYDFPYTAEDGGDRGKILFVLW